MVITQIRFSVFRIFVCLLVCCALLLSCLPIKAEAVLIETTLAYGVTALLVLFGAGVVFQVNNLNEIKAIGQNFHSHMLQWGAANNLSNKVNDWFQNIKVDITGGSGGVDPRIIMDSSINAGITLWIYNIIKNLTQVENTFEEPSVGYSATAVNSYTTYYCFDDSMTQLAKTFPSEVWDSLPLLGVNEYVMITGISSNSPYNLYGFYFDESGVFTSAILSNPLGVVNASLYGIYDLSNFEVLQSYSVGSKDSSYIYGYKIFYSKAYAEQHPDYLVSSCLAFNFNASDPVYKMYDSLYKSYGVLYKFYLKDSKNTTWNTSTVERLLYNEPCTGYYPDMNSVTWDDRYPVVSPDSMVGDIVEGVQSGDLDQDDIPVADIDYSMVFPDNVGVLEGVQNIGQLISSGDLSLDKYQNMIDAGSSAAAVPVFVSDIPFGSSITYTQGAAAAPISVIASASDGGTISYEWYRYGKDSSGKLYDVNVLGTSSSFVPSTAELGTTYYYCRVINTSPDGMVAYNYSSAISVKVVSGAGTDTESETKPGVIDYDKIGSTVEGAISGALPGTLTDVFTGLFEQSSTKEEDRAHAIGNDAASDLIDLIPDYSSGFLPSLKSLAGALGYEGTTCVLTMPAIKVPAVSDLFGETTFLEEQSIDFEEYFQKIPSSLLNIVRVIFDITLVVFCLKEVSDLIRRALTGFKDDSKDVND